jgi:glycosyltransferase involved in cell wall biosynthesis
MTPEIAILSPIGRSGLKHHGGITPVTYRLANEFLRLGVTTELVAFAPVDPRSSMPFLNSKVPIYNLGVSTKIIQAWRLWRYMKIRSPRVLLSAGTRANLIACLTKRLHHPAAKVVLSIHNTLSKELTELPYFRRWRRMKFIRALYHKADGFICVSNGVAEDLAVCAGIPRTSIQVIYNPIVTPEIMKQAEVSVSHQWFQSNHPPVILGAGRLTTQKDFATLIKAFSLVQAKIPSRLVILGEGDNRDELKRLVRKLNLEQMVDLPGFVENSVAYMKRARLFVLSSAWEGFGNVLVESMAVGTPVVATDCPSGPREILLDGKIGALVSPKRPDMLAQAIIQTLVAPPNPAVLQKRSAEFSAEESARRYLKFLFDQK